MTLGDKIRKFRNLHNLSQKELGLKMGFSSASADVRIRQYESNTKYPRDDIRKKFAEILDVDISALSDIEIQSDEDIMQTLFYLSEILNIDIEKTEDKFYLSFDANNKENELLMSYLTMWYEQKKNLRNTSNSSSEDLIHEYELWKARFPKDIKEYWREQADKINTYYESIVWKIKQEKEPIVNVSEFIQQIRKMIQSGLNFDIETKLIDEKISALKFTFLTEDLLSPESEHQKNSFGEFLFILNTLETYGMPFKTEILTLGKGTQISYYLCLSQLGAFAETIEKLQNFEISKNKKSQWEIDLFESTYEKNLKRFDFNLKEEIEQVHKK